MARNRHLITGFAVVAAVGVVPVVAALDAPDSVPQAQPGCLSWYGSKVDGKCIAWSMSSGVDSQINGIPITINGPTGENGTSNSQTIYGGRGSGLPRN